MVFSGGYAAYAFEQEMNGPTWVQPAGRGAAPQCEAFEVELINQINLVICVKLYIYTVYNYIYILYMYNDMYILGFEWKTHPPFMSNTHML